MRALGAFVALLLCLPAVVRAATVAIPQGCAAQAPWGGPDFRDAATHLTVLCRGGYVAIHDDDKRVPAFVSWELTRDHALGCLPRQNTFRPDPDLLRGRRAELNDYRRQLGFDRGHFAPNADFAWDQLVQRESFYLSNMSPQASDLNQQAWAELEDASRAWAVARDRLVVMSGPIWQAPVETIGDDAVAVPAAYWKVIVDPKAMQGQAFVMKNAPLPRGALAEHAVSLATVEAAANLKLPLPAGLGADDATAPWPVDLHAFRLQKTLACSGVR